MQHQTAMTDILDRAVADPCAWFPKDALEQALGSRLQSMVWALSLIAIRREFECRHTDGAGLVPWDEAAVQEAIDQFESTLTVAEELIATSFHRWILNAVSDEVRWVCRAAASRPTSPPDGGTAADLESASEDRAHPGPKPLKALEGIETPLPTGHVLVEESSAGAEPQPPTQTQANAAPAAPGAAAPEAGDPSPKSGTDLVCLITEPTANVMSSMKFIEGLRRRNEFRVLRIMGHHKDGCRIWLAPRGPFAIEALLRELPEVADIVSSDPEPPSGERRVIVHLRELPSAA